MTRFAGSEGLEVVSKRSDDTSDGSQGLKVVSERSDDTFAGKKGLE